MHYHHRRIARSVALCNLITAGLGSYLLPYPALLAQEASVTNAPATLDKVTIVGSLLTYSSETETAQPVRIIDSIEIERSPARNVAELLRREPSMNFGGFNGVADGAVGTSGAQGVSLRGLGPEATLVLLNGRRVASLGNYAGSAENSFVDLNTFPLLMVDSVQILKDGASATYGADAVGGVIDIRTKRRVSGGEMFVEYGDTTHRDDTSIKQGSITWGALNAKTDVFVGFSYYQRNALYERDRDFSASADQRPRGGQDGRSFSNNPGYFAVPRTNAVLQASGIAAGLTDDIVLVSPGRGAGGTSPVNSWVAGDVISLYDDPRVGGFDFNEYTIAIGAREQFSGYFNANHWLVDEDRLAIFGDVLANRVTTESAQAPGPVSNFGDEGIVIPASNVYNPFGVDISGSSRYRPTEGGPRFTTLSTDYVRLVGGFRGTISSISVNWEGAAWYNESNSDDVGRYVSRSGFNAALALPGAAAYNPFASSQNEFAGNVAALDAVGARVETTTHFASKLYGGDFRLTGEHVELPAGKISWAAGGEFRREEWTRTPDPILAGGDLIGFFATDPEPPFANDRDIASGFGEVRVPLFSPAQKITGLYRLSVNGAGRYESYSDIGSTAVPKACIQWHPFNDELMLRGTWGQGFRAPSLIQVNPQFVSQGGVIIVDSLPGGPTTGTAFETSVVATGNPNLQPEDSETVSMGWIYSPKYVRNLSLGMDFWQTDRKGIVGGPNWQEIVDNDPLDPRIERDPGTGEIIRIVSQLNNGGRYTVRGVDFDVQYVFATDNAGEFVLKVGATYVDSFKIIYPGSQVSLQAVGDGVEAAAAPDAYLRWAGNGSLFWTFKNLTIGGNAQYVDSVLEEYDYDPVTDASILHRVPAYFRFDMQASYQLPWRTKLTVGVNNVLDVDPPLSAFYSSSSGYLTSLYDPTGRFVYFNVTKKF